MVRNENKIRVLCVLCLLISLVLAVLCLGACNNNAEPINLYDVEQITAVHKFEPNSEVSWGSVAFSQSYASDNAEYFFSESIAFQDVNKFITRIERFFELTSYENPEGTIKLYVGDVAYNFNKVDGNTNIFISNSYNPVDAYTTLIWGLSNADLPYGVYRGFAHYAAQRLNLGTLDIDNVNESITSASDVIFDLEYPLFLNDYTTAANVKGSESLSYFVIKDLIDGSSLKSVFNSVLLGGRQQWQVKLNTCYSEFNKSVMLGDDIYKFYNSKYPVYVVTTKGGSIHFEKNYRDMLLDIDFDYIEIKTFLQGINAQALDEIRSYFPQTVNQSSLRTFFVTKTDSNGSGIFHGANSRIDLNYIFHYLYGYVSNIMYQTTESTTVAPWLIAAIPNYFSIEYFYYFQRMFYADYYESAVERDEELTILTNEIEELYNKTFGYPDSFEDFVAFDLIDTTAYVMYKRDESTIYNQNESFINFLIKEYGFDMVLQLYYSNNNYESSFGKVRDEILEEFKAYLINKFEG